MYEVRITVAITLIIIHFFRPFQCFLMLISEEYSYSNDAEIPDRTSLHRVPQQSIVLPRYAVD